MQAKKQNKRSKVLNAQYDDYSDRLANIVWNRDICRRDTGENRGKGVCVYVHCSCILCMTIARLSFSIGIFCLVDLPKNTVTSKYEGHLVHPDGTIVQRCTRTNILFSYR